jgi:linoleate 10R-lipoxygenase
MFKRFSIRKGKKEENGSVPNGTNGVHAEPVNGTSSANGNANGFAATNAANSFSKPTKRFSFAAPKRQDTTFSQPDHSVTRGDVDSTFEQFAQLIHASNRPLPTQTGDGSYLEHDVPSSLFQDLKSLGFKDVKTLREVLANKASNALNDDKTMLMERIIQVLSPSS